MSAEHSPSLSLSRAYPHHPQRPQRLTPLSPLPLYTALRPSSISAATIILAIFALLALFEILKLDKATTTITSNLDAIIASLSDIQKGVNESYEATTLMPLLLDMNEQTKYIEGNLSITVDAMINSPVLAGGLVGRR